MGAKAETKLLNQANMGEEKFGEYTLAMKTTGILNLFICIQSFCFKDESLHWIDLKDKLPFIKFWEPPPLRRKSGHVVMYLGMDSCFM